VELKMTTRDSILELLARGEMSSFDIVDKLSATWPAWKRAIHPFLIYPELRKMTAEGVIVRREGEQRVWERGGRPRVFYSLRGTHR